MPVDPTTPRRHRIRRRALALAAALFLFPASELPVQAARQERVPRERRERDPHAAAKDRAEDAPPPALPSTGWIGATDASPTWGGLRGRLVLVWHVDLTDSRAARLASQVQDLADQFAEVGLTVLGIQAPTEDATLAELVAQHGIEFPMVADTEGALAAAWMVDDRPDAWLIGRDGHVRVADIADHALGTAVQFVLRESPAPPPELPRTPLDERVRTLVETWPSAVYGLFMNGERLGTLTLRNRLVPSDAGGPPQLELVDEQVVSIQTLRVTTDSTCRYAFDASRVRLVAGTSAVRGVPGAERDARVLREDERLAFESAGQRLTPIHPAITDLFLGRAPALSAVDQDPFAQRSWMNFVDGKLYDGLRLRPVGTGQREVLGAEVPVTRWHLAGTGQATTSVYEYDATGMLQYALLEATVEVVLERRGT